MFNTLFSNKPFCQAEAIAVARIITGAFMIYHGAEIFSSQTIQHYLEWDMFKNLPNGKLLVYMGKSAEFIGGLLLFTGLFTRLACIILGVDMFYITFFVGNGKIWYDAQHPFMFVLMAALLFFTGPGKWNLDSPLFKNR
ncbi:MAG TPA: DoxX family protein [Panacibacter sp.]|nr:DoxX family protein [Panacibacter sp.]HNP44767.1 DoxX family protein [Panacibacter sp.]